MGPVALSRSQPPGVPCGGGQTALPSPMPLAGSARRGGMNWGTNVASLPPDDSRAQPKMPHFGQIWRWVFAATPNIHSEFRNNLDLCRSLVRD